MTVNPPSGIFTPNKLIELFCCEELRSAEQKVGRDEQERCEWHAGSCAARRPAADAPGGHGFENGYLFSGELGRAGWVLMYGAAGQGFPRRFDLEWHPTTRAAQEVLLTRAGYRGFALAERVGERLQSPDGRWCIACYREGALAIAVYDDEAAFRVAQREVREP